MRPPPEEVVTLYFLGVEVPVAPAWLDLTKDEEFLRAMAATEEAIRPDAETGLLTPPTPGQILRIFSVPDVKVVLVGQDPYFNAGEATGFAFEVGGITHWKCLLSMPSEAVPSLKRILRKLHMDYTGAEQPASLEEVAAAADDGSFPILPPNELFGYWADCGVLLLNRRLTTRLGRPFAHRAVWSKPARLIKKYLRRKWPEAVWFLWGDDAQKMGADVPADRKWLASHPSPRNIPYADSRHFINSYCFACTWNEIDWLGLRRNEKREEAE